MLQEAVVQPRPSLQSRLNQRYQGVDVGAIGKCGHVETFRSPIIFQEIEMATGCQLLRTHRSKIAETA